MSFLNRRRRRRRQRKSRARSVSVVEPIDLKALQVRRASCPVEDNDDTCSSSSSSSISQRRKKSPHPHGHGQSPSRDMRFNLRNKCLENVSRHSVWQPPDQPQWTFHFIYLSTQDEIFECDQPGLLFLYSGHAILTVNGSMQTLRKEETVVIADMSTWSLSWKRATQLLEVRAVFIQSVSS